MQEVSYTYFVFHKWDFVYHKRLDKTACCIFFLSHVASGRAQEVIEKMEAVIPNSARYLSIPALGALQAKAPELVDRGEVTGSDVLQPGDKSWHGWGVGRGGGKNRGEVTGSDVLQPCDKSWHSWGKGGENRGEVNESDVLQPCDKSWHSWGKGGENRGEVNESDVLQPCNKSWHGWGWGEGGGEENRGEVNGSYVLQPCDKSWHGGGGGERGEVTGSDALQPCDKSRHSWWGGGGGGGRSEVLHLYDKSWNDWGKQDGGGGGGGAELRSLGQMCYTLVMRADMVGGRPEALGQTCCSIGWHGLVGPLGQTCCILEVRADMVRGEGGRGEGHWVRHAASLK